MLTSSVPVAQDRAGIRLLVLGAPAADARRGIDLGIAEMSQTARLLKRDVQEVTAQSAADSLDAVIVGPRAPRTARTRVPHVHLGALPKDGGSCSFTVATLAQDHEVTWHSSLNRYGASELNERFVKRYGTGMTPDGYAGWIAVKAVVEAALRPVATNDKCTALGRLRFDGHKGRPLAFDPVSRVLQQPLYVLENGRPVEAKR